MKKKISQKKHRNRQYFYNQLEDYGKSQYCDKHVIFIVHIIRSSGLATCDRDLSPVFTYPVKHKSNKEHFKNPCGYAETSSHVTIPAKINI